MNASIIKSIYGKRKYGEYVLSDVREIKYVQYATLGKHELLFNWNHFNWIIVHALLKVRIENILL